ncbi:unnamed protein product, partial [Closterium sp. Naga37s-1]
MGPATSGVATAGDAANVGAECDAGGRGGEATQAVVRAAGRGGRKPLHHVALSLRLWLPYHSG